MGTKIMVDPSALTSTAASIETYASDYKRYYEQMLTEVNNMAESWSGQDNVSYTNVIRGYEQNFKEMYDLLTNYVSYLRDSAQRYSNAQDNISNAAKTL